MIKNHAPATLRNREPIRRVLAEELEQAGFLLEIAAGTGEHAVFLSREFPEWQWQPTDPDPAALSSITAWREDEGAPNLLPPMRLDAASTSWDVDTADAVLCVNMVHISPPAATKGLFAGATGVLQRDAPLLIYGPFIENGVETAASNLDFDASLKARNPDWGLRDIAWMDELAKANGMRRTARHEMPANNLTLVYRKR